MRKALLLAITLLPLGTALASDYLFLNAHYLDLTGQMLNQADARAAADLTPEAAAKYREAVSGLRRQIDSIRQARLFKKLKAESVAEVKDREFADNLNIFKFALRAIATKAGKPLQEVFPAYEEWIKTETAVVQAGVGQRLQAFETRFGSDSEQVNFMELFLGEAFLKGDESAPNSWEPILRLSAVQLTTSGPGLTSSFQAGANYYFLKGSGMFRWVGVNNHLGLAASLQYLNDPRLMRFEGRPAFGLVVHLDRKEVGASWDPDQKTVRMSLGYAFQFIPLLL